MTYIAVSLVAQQYRIYLQMQEMQETWVQSLGQEDPSEKEMTTYSSVLARKFHVQKGLAVYGYETAKKLDTT